MDPLTQATIGAAAAAVFSSRDRVRLALCVGAVAGAAPDLDVLIRSAADPLLALQYHRHFTHALLFAPVVGLATALLFRLLFFWKKWPLAELARYGIAGALTHGLIDACTSYGTLLYLPFSDHRESWDLISIIDPLFTVPLCILTVSAFAWRRPAFARVGVLLCAAYLAAGLVQRERAEAVAAELARLRGHEPTMLTARPSLGNILLWRILYRDGGFYHVDAVRLPFFGGERTIYDGRSVAAFDPQEGERRFSEASVLGNDIARFRTFSQGYLYHYQDPEIGSVVGDLRYAMFPDSVVPLWGVRYDPGEPERHVRLEYFRDASAAAFDRLWRMIRGLPVEPQ